MLIFGLKLFEAKHDIDRVVDHCDDQHQQTDAKGQQSQKFR